MHWAIKSSVESASVFTEATTVAHALLQKMQTRQDFV